jgi:hypothetical protein
MRDLADEHHHAADPVLEPVALGLDVDDFGAAGFVAAAPTAPRPTRDRSERISGGAH